MLLRISPEVLEKIPGLTVAVYVFAGLNNQKKSSNVSQLLRGVVAGKKTDLKNEEKKKKIMDLLKRAGTEEKILKEAHLLKSFLSKAGTGKDIESVNNLTDISHYLAIKNLLPIHGQDLDQTEKDIICDFIVPKKGKKAIDMDFAKDTVNAVLWVVDIGAGQKEDFEKVADECAKTAIKYCGGKMVGRFILNAEVTECDLGYTSQKETEYKEAQKGELMSEAAKEEILQSDKVPFINEEKISVNVEISAKQQLITALEEAVSKYLAANSIEAGESSVEIETPHDTANGDYAASIAMKMAKITGRNPREVAEGIIQNLPRLDYVEKTEIAGPGFINFHLSTPFLAAELDLINRQKNNFGRITTHAGKKVLIEYSQPNIAKPLGVHHLLSTIIGQTLVDLFRFGGYEVVALNYLGDWGTQFGKLLYAYKNWGDEETVKKDPLNELLKLYVRFHDEAEKDIALEDKGREEFKKLEEGDEENKKLWSWMKDLSVQEIERLYKILGVHFDECLGEQMYSEKSRTVLEEGKARGIVTTGEKGALIARFDDEKIPPYVLQKSDGTTLYSTRDIASIKDRIERWHPDELIYVVDVAQSLHFKQLFELAQKFGFTGPQYTHVVFGRMQLPEGRMSTRKGDVILLDEVIKEAVSRTEKLVEEKSGDLDKETKEFIAREMAISAIKYNIISQNRETNITFSWEKMLALDGNSGPYLQYACARAHSILRKARDAAATESATKPAAKPAKIPKFIKESNQTDLFSLTEEVMEEKSVVKQGEQEDAATPFGHEAEKRLLRMLPRLPEFVELAIKEYKPNLLTNYLFDLARAFNTFYGAVPVLNAVNPEVKNARIKLVQGVSQVLGNGLKVLGITVFERI